MPSPEFNRRHYGIVADETLQARSTVPTNMARRTALQTGIYEAPSNPVPTDADSAPTPLLIRLTPEQVDTWAVDSWKKGTSGLSASGEKLIKPVDILVVPKKTKDLPIIVREPE